MRTPVELRTNTQHWIGVVAALVELVCTSAALALDPSNEDKTAANALAITSFLVKMGDLTNSALVESARRAAGSNGAVRATGSLRALGSAFKVGGLGLSLYGLYQSKEDYKASMSSGDHDLHAINTASMLTAGAGSLVAGAEAAMMIFVGSSSLGPVGAVVGIVLAVGGVALFFVANQWRDTTPQLDVGYTWFGTNYADGSDRTLDRSNLYGQIRAQTALLRGYFFAGEMSVKRAKVSNSDQQNLIITVSKVPPLATIFVQTWPGSQNLYLRSFTWVKLGRDGAELSAGHLWDFKREATSGNTYKLLANGEPRLVTFMPFIGSQGTASEVICQTKEPIYVNVSRDGNSFTVQICVRDDNNSDRALVAAEIDSDQSNTEQALIRLSDGANGATGTVDLATLHRSMARFASRLVLVED